MQLSSYPVPGRGELECRFGRAIHLCISRNSNKRFNNTLNDTMQTRGVFGAETVQWTNLVCTFDAASFENTLRRLTGSIRPVVGSPTISSITLPPHMTMVTPTLLWPAILALVHPTPRSHTAAPSPSSLISGMGCSNGMKPVLPLYSLPHP